MPPIATNIEEFQISLLEWFEKMQRHYLPWRSTDNAFIILVAEKLLQQTSARQLVLDAFQKIVDKYPTPEKLAAADVDELKSMMHSLGFTYRAHELKAMSAQLLERFNGNMPSSLDELLSLPGVGPYCARAVLSFAYKQDIAIVDTNVARFLYRLYGFADPVPSGPASSKKLTSLAQSLIPVGRSREYNLAILDLCAFVCTKRNPDCDSCPVLRFCAYGQASISSSDSDLIS